MRQNILILVLVLSSCGAMIHFEREDRARCEPVCGADAYAGTDDNGSCVCDK